MTVAATQMADMKVWAQRSQRVWIRRQSLSLPNMFSILYRWRWSAGSYGIGTFRLAFDGMQGVISRPATTARNQSAS